MAKQAAKKAAKKAVSESVAEEKKVVKAAPVEKKEDWKSAFDRLEGRYAALEARVTQLENNPR